MTYLPPIQLAFCLFLILWLGLRPFAGRWRWVQAAVVGLVVAGVGLVGIWQWPSIHTPWALGGLWALVAAFGLRRRTAWRGSRLVAGLAVLALVAVGAGLIGLAVDGRRAPGGPVVDLAAPLPGGVYWVANGGRHEAINAHLSVARLPDDRAERWQGQMRGADLIAVDDWGRRKGPGPGEDPASYLIWGRPVLAPCGGTVVAAEGALPDMPVPRMDLDYPMGNHVVLDCGGYWVVMAHLRQGTVSVTAGQAVAQGAPLAEVGNSGRSAEPHLHIHVQDPATPDNPVAAAPQWARIAGQFPARGRLLRLK